MAESTMLAQTGAGPSAEASYQVLAVHKRREQLNCLLEIAGLVAMGSAPGSSARCKMNELDAARCVGKVLRVSCTFPSKVFPFILIITPQDLLRL